MNSRSNDRPDADALDAFWDELVLGRKARQAGTPEEEMVLTLQNTMALDDPSADSRLRDLVFGSAPEDNRDRCAGPRVAQAETRADPTQAGRSANTPSSPPPRWP